MQEKDVIIDFRSLNTVIVNEAKTQMRIGGGTINGELVNVAFENKLQVSKSTYSPPI